MVAGLRQTGQRTPEWRKCAGGISRCYCQVSVFLKRRKGNIMPGLRPMTARAKMCLVASFAAIALVGCSGGSSAPSGAPSGGSSGAGTAASDPIVIGISLPLTGDFSEPGRGVQHGYDVWAKVVNDKGGLLGRQVKLKVLDDQSNADRVVADYESLIAQDQVDLVFGPFSTRLVVPSARVAKGYGMLFVEPAGAAAEVFNQGFTNLFYTAPAIANDHYHYLPAYPLALPP